MQTLLVPTFDYDSKFEGYKKVKVTNKMTHKDEQKVLRFLPGFKCGYCPALSKILTTKENIEITRFYDIRQRGVRKLKNLYISVASV